jgi:hypothetical protein
MQILSEKSPKVASKSRIDIRIAGVICPNSDRPKSVSGKL